MLPDEYSVAFMAMKIGLCLIENSEEDAISLRNRIWLENGMEDKLKQELIAEMDSELEAYNLENLEDLSAEEVLNFYQKIKRCENGEEN